MKHITPRHASHIYYRFTPPPPPRHARRHGDADAAIYAAADAILLTAIDGRLITLRRIRHLSFLFTPLFTPWLHAINLFNTPFNTPLIRHDITTFCHYTAITTYGRHFHLITLLSLLLRHLIFISIRHLHAITSLRHATPFHYAIYLRITLFTPLFIYGCFLLLA
jgi:hypothetical protein